MLAQHEQIVKSSIYHYSENSGYDPRRWRRHEVDQLTYTDYRNESPVRFFHAFKKAKTAENLDGFSGQTIYTPLLFSGSRGFVLFEAQKDKKISHYPAFTRRFMFCTAAFRKHCSRMFLIPSKRAQRRPWFFFASAKNLSIVSFLQLYRLLPLCVFVRFHIVIVGDT